MKLRYYQKEAVLACYRYLLRKKGNPVLALPTGTGKSWIIAALIKLLREKEKARIIVLTHSKELIIQNIEKTMFMNDGLDVGVYSSGLSRNDVGNAVTFAGIQSCYNKAEFLGSYDYAIVDECHMISEASDTMYQSFLNALCSMKSGFRTIGLTATQWRLKSGLLVDGDIFSDVCFDLTGLEQYNRLVEEGYLSPLIVKETENLLDTSNVGLRGREFIPTQLQAAVNDRNLTRAAVAETILKGANRKHWLVFAAGVEHCELINRIFHEFGVDSACCHSRMSPKQRDRNIAKFKSGKLKVLINNDMLTTGFDYTKIDLLAILRPTWSPGLWVQILGRGTRVDPEKENCLVLDFAGNTKRLGQINNVQLPNWNKRKKERDGQAPVKTCPQCSSIVSAGVRVCPDCNFKFPHQPYLSRRASEIDVVADKKPGPKRIKVKKVRYNKHNKKGRKPSLKVTYNCGVAFYREWVCFEHGGYAGNTAAPRWWRQRTDLDVPETVDEVIKLKDELAQPVEILVSFDGKYPEVIDYFF